MQLHIGIMMTYSERYFQVFGSPHVHTGIVCSNLFEVVFPYGKKATSHSWGSETLSYQHKDVLNLAKIDMGLRHRIIWHEWTQNTNKIMLGSFLHAYRDNYHASKKQPILLNSVPMCSHRCSLKLIQYYYLQF